MAKSTEEILMGSSMAEDPEQALQDIFTSIVQAQTHLVILFCSSRYDLHKIEKLIPTIFQGITVIGCTTAGEIGIQGFQVHGISAIGFASSSTTFVIGNLDNLTSQNEQAATNLTDKLLYELSEKGPYPSPENTFCFLLIDGLSVSEERIARGIQKSLGRIPLTGGSAGDDQKFLKTQVLIHDSFKSNRAVIVLIHTLIPFLVFKNQHVQCRPDPLIVTKVQQDQRIIQEINGQSAASVYAQLIGVKLNELSENYFSAYPLVVKINGSEYIRSIQKVLDDGSLVLYCTIDRGVILKIGQMNNLVDTRKEIFEILHQQISTPSVILAFDCIQCKLEAIRDNLDSQISELYKDNHVIGFNTYGEQYLGNHINHTITGIAFGKRKTHVR